MAIRSSGRNSAIGDEIGDNAAGGIPITGPVPFTHVRGDDIATNAGNGVTLAGTHGLAIGGDLAGESNAITGNLGFGLSAAWASEGTLVQGNAITSNAAGDVNLSKSKGVRYIPATSAS